MGRICCQELGRREFIDLHHDEIKVWLREKNITDFDGEYIENPYDVEWGKIKFAMSARNSDYQYYLYLSQEERNAILLYSACRNTIAHGDCCSLKQMNEILV